MPPVSLPFHPLRAGLLLLLEALDWASASGIAAWDFAVEIRQLHQAGLSKTHLRWLISGGYVEHAFEFTLSGDEKRSFRPLKTLRFCQRSCFLLTPAGAEFARTLCEQAAASESAGNHSSHAVCGQRETELLVKPHWEPRHRRLTVGDDVVKHFQRPASVQEMLLAAFEEEEWSPRIDDPLPRVAGQDPKRRLRGAIESLNRRRLSRRIHFFGDGTGEGVCWTLVPS